MNNFFKTCIAWWQKEWKECCISNNITESALQSAKKGYSYLGKMFLVFFLFLLIFDAFFYFALPENDNFLTLQHPILMLNTLVFCSHWFLINKRLFVPAYYTALLGTALLSYQFIENHYTSLHSPELFYSCNQRGLIQHIVEFLGWFFLFFSPIGVVFLYFILADYPKKIIKTAKKLKLGYWKNEP